MAQSARGCERLRLNVPHHAASPNSNKKPTAKPRTCRRLEEWRVGTHDGWQQRASARVPGEPGSGVMCVCTYTRVLGAGARNGDRWLQM